VLNPATYREVRGFILLQRLGDAADDPRSTSGASGLDKHTIADLDQPPAERE